jgi:MinD-like ATPase involved in chromosome partitioning or flagellar assembly
VLWLVTPQVASIRDNMQALHVLEQAGLSRDKVRFIANHPTAHDDVPIASIAAAMQGEIYWTIPYDTALYRQSQLGRTVEQYSGSSAAADAITALARAIAGMPVGSRGRARRWPRLRPQRARVGAAS